MILGALFLVGFSYYGLWDFKRKAGEGADVFLKSNEYIKVSKTLRMINIGITLLFVLSLIVLWTRL